ncbi:unnamed protein product [Arctogadus glacialis]
MDDEMNRGVDAAESILMQMVFLTAVVVISESKSASVDDPGSPPLWWSSWPRSTGPRPRRLARDHLRTVNGGGVRKLQGTISSPGCNNTTRAEDYD